MVTVPPPNRWTDGPVARPAWRHATSASPEPNESSHTVPHALSWLISTRQQHVAEPDDWGRHATKRISARLVPASAHGAASAGPVPQHTPASSLCAQLWLPARGSHIQHNSLTS
jgi:hypothetical protein